MRVDFNKEWKFKGQIITLPHDAMLQEKRSADAPGKSASGFFVGGIYTYEKEFEVTEEQLHKHMVLEFEGVYKNAVVSVNGTLVHKASYGYTPFFVSLDGLLKEGKNIICVTADNKEQPDSRWYSGAGIYRPVWLHIKPGEYIKLEGVQIQTVSINPPQIAIRVKHCSAANKIGIVIRDNEEKTVSQMSYECASEGTTSDDREDQIKLELPDGKLWSEESPNLYTAYVSIRNNEEILDSSEASFGIRKLEWNADGFFVNGRKTLLRGGCLHHDNGIVGACAYAQSEERRVRILKENGFNAIRSAHNPCSKAMLEACDKYGIYIMDELWDMWYQHKSKYDYASQLMEHYREDIEAMVSRDYNHPSVIMYSIGNEVSEPAKPKGIELAKEMVVWTHKLDESRAVTGGFNLMIIANAAKGKEIYNGDEGGRDESNDKKMDKMNSTMFNMIVSMVGTSMNKAANGKKADLATTPILDALDIAGYNYASGRYPLEGSAHPNRVIFGSETFPQDIAKNWAMVQKYSYLIGDFMWTAWDYLGEAGIGAWSYEADAKGFNKPYPWLLADTGAFDILGNPNGEAMLASAVWGTEENIYIGVRPCNHPNEKIVKASWRGTNALPSWSWNGCDGNKVTIEVFSKAYEVELWVNDKSLGKKKTKGCVAAYKTKYVPGVLRAQAYDAAGRKVASTELKSAEKSLNIHIEQEVIHEKTSVRAGDIIYCPVCIADQNGITESNADTKVCVNVTGGELLGFGSANPRTEESYQTGIYTTYYGKALVIVRAGESGTLQITADTATLGSSSLKLEIEAEQEHITHEGEGK